MLNDEIESIILMKCSCYVSEDPVFHVFNCYTSLKLCLLVTYPY